MAVYEDVKRALQEILTLQLGEVRGEMAALRAEIKADIKDVRSEMAALRAEIKADIKDARSEIVLLRAEMRQDINNIHIDLVRIEQVFDARLQTLGVIERVARLEERLAGPTSPPAPAV